MIHDQYYTRPEVAQWLITQLKKLTTPETLWFEPSAGTGAFFNLLPSNRIGIDIDPKSDGIVQGDFLQYRYDGPEDVIVVGNPPFGKNSSQAVKFFNHAAKFARIIAFILPQTFRKESVINRLDPYFHLVHDETLPKFSFIADGEPYDVPCCYQIRVRKDIPRTKFTLPKTSPDFEFTTRARADFAVQRVGVNAGRVKDIDDQIATASHYFIRGPVRNIMESLNFNQVKLHNAGNPSISKGELVALYTLKSEFLSRL